MKHHRPKRGQPRKKKSKLKREDSLFNTLRLNEFLTDEEIHINNPAFYLIEDSLKSWLLTFQGNKRVLPSQIRDSVDKFTEILCSNYQNQQNSTKKEAEASRNRPTT